MKNKLLFVLILLILFASPVFSDDNVVVKWLKKIGNGENLNEPIAPIAILTKDIADYLKKIGPPKSDSFLACMAVIDKNFPYDSSQVNWASVKNLKFKNLSYDLIANVLKRRTPIINIHPYDKKAYPYDSPRTMYRLGNFYNIEYWAAFQIAVLENLIKENDTRFEKEARELLSYLVAPLPPGKNRWDYDQEKMEEADARWSSNDLQWLQYPLIEYLNLFRLKRGEEIINTSETRENLIKKYGFGENCDYYQQGKWAEFLKGPPTEEEMQRFREISRQSREESARRAKQNERQNDETFLRNALETLQQPNLSTQTREYLEKCVNHIRNKKYE